MAKKRERPPIDLLVDRLPAAWEKRGYTLEDHVRAALTHNLSLVRDRLAGIEQVFEELHALSTRVEAHDPTVAQQMRTTISFGRAVELQSAQWLIEAFINGLNPYAIRGAADLVGKRGGSKAAQETVKQERDPLKQTWRDDAIRHWKENPFRSIRDVGRRIQRTCVVRKPRSDKPYTLDHICLTIRDLKPTRR